MSTSYVHDQEQEDIEILEKAIRAFKSGSLPEDRFKNIRTTRGVYSQRQPGGQMVRIKLPLGRVTFSQLLCLAGIADEYSTGLIHFTTRQDIQIYHVSLERTVELWARLERENITLKGAGGNTVRNVTASPEAGIDPAEPFDVSPHAWSVFTYFLHNPVCQEMGRKIKISFSSGDTDTACSFMQDLGFIPVVRSYGTSEQRGFRVLLGGGLGAQPFLATKVIDFLPENELIPFTEALLRVFNRYGERNNRSRARLKYLVQKTGTEELMKLIGQEKAALAFKTFEIDPGVIQALSIPPAHFYDTEIGNLSEFALWIKTNVFEQKQAGYHGVYIKLPAGGDLTSKKIRALVSILKDIASDDVRITQGQNLLLRYVKREALPFLFARLSTLGLALPGAYDLSDITACRGTESCNLAISNSLGLASVLENVITTEYKTLIGKSGIRIKISGCMNSCGQHVIANIGFQGCAMRAGTGILPAVQILLGGGITGEGTGKIADKALKVPARRAPSALRLLLDHYGEKALAGETYIHYYNRSGKDFFYHLLKPLADLTDLKTEDFIDWGQKETYKTQIGTGECAGSTVDLLSFLTEDAYSKLAQAQHAADAGYFADSVHHTYTALITAAKTFLLGKEVSSSSQHRIITDFDKHFAISGHPFRYKSFEELVMQVNQKKPDQNFARLYLQQSADFIGNPERISSR